MSELVAPPEIDYSNPNWKLQPTLSHYDLERQKQMLLYQVERCLDNAGIDNPLVNEFMKTEHDRIIKCLSENPINYEIPVKINYIPVYENPSDLTQVPNSEENAVKGT